MTNETMIELCNTVSSLAEERDAWRRKVESQAARHSDEVEALRAERDEARCNMLDAATDRNDANHAADKAQWDAEQPRRELAAMQAERSELADLRAKLALQTQIATGAATQRDEQTARLADAQAEIAALRAERDELKASKPACQHAVREAMGVTEWSHFEVPDVSGYRMCAQCRYVDDGIVAAEVYNLHVDGKAHYSWEIYAPTSDTLSVLAKGGPVFSIDAAKRQAFDALSAHHLGDLDVKCAKPTSKPTVDVDGLRRAIHRAWWEDNYDPASNVAKAALEYLGLTPATRTGEVTP